MVTNMKLRLLFCTMAAAVALTPSRSDAQPATPQYGGELRIATVYAALPALSWDPADFNWKINHDAGGTYEMLFSADLAKAVRNGGKHRFVADAWIPSDAVRGELAESWKWTGPLTVEIRLRKGIMFPAKEGVMAARELEAQDVVYSYYRLDNSPKKTPTYMDHIAKAEAVDKHTVRFTFKEYNAEWDFRFGWGYTSAIVPKEVVTAGAGNWRNMNGTGPFKVSNYVAGNATTYVKNTDYWDQETIAGRPYKLPFVDKVTYQQIKDESTRYSLLRTGRLDIVEGVRPSEVEALKKQVPELKWSRTLTVSGTYLALRVDTKPFDDIRVRRAMNLAVDRAAIVKSIYRGEAEIFAYPMHPDYHGYWEPLSAMPASTQELFTFDPAKAKRLLAEAGLPNGFTFKLQYVATNPTHTELVQLLTFYFEQIGVKVELQPMEYTAFLSAMNTRTNAPGYLMDKGHTNPTSSLRTSFLTGQTWNASQWSDPALDKAHVAMLNERDETKRQATIKALTRSVLDNAPGVWLPTPYQHVAWWPWVKNYDGELRAGAQRPWPVYSRLWIDQDMKKRMGK